MKLKRLSIQKLYGCYDYDIIFNPDVTLLYGLNGCGKTTVLNIINIIISGRLFELFNYNFYEIQLTYNELKEDAINDQVIIINIIDNILRLEFEGNIYSIRRLDDRLRFYADQGHVVAEKKQYFREYEVLNRLKNTFNQLYLPLNRLPSNIDEDDSSSKLRISDITWFESGNERSSDTIENVSQIVKEHYSIINSEIAKLNDQFRNNILTSLLEFHNSDVLKSLNNIFSHEIDITEVESIREAYIKILNELNIIKKKKEETNYNKFFIDLISSVQNNPESRGVSIEQLITYYEIKKMKQLADIVEKNEIAKAFVKQPLAVFLSTINEFIGIGDDNKNIEIDELGELFFTTKHSSEHVSISKLSSGEKQILILFANLLFHADKNRPFIFLEDEPELSLHLAWQKKFVDKALQVNPDMQLILATHAPEIVAKHVDKMVRLEKKYVK